MGFRSHRPYDSFCYVFCLSHPLWLCVENEHVVGFALLAPASSLSLWTALVAALNFEGDLPAPFGHSLLHSWFLSFARQGFGHIGFSHRHRNCANAVANTLLSSVD